MSFLSTNFADNKLQTFLVAAVLLLAAGGLLYLVYRGLAGGRNRIAAARSRQQRLGVVDSYDIDRQRQLVIVRRDNTEHLIMIGGPNDVVIEAAIIRAEAREGRGVRERENGAPAWAASLESPAEAAGTEQTNPYTETIAATMAPSMAPPASSPDYTAPSRELPKLPDLFARTRKPKAGVEKTLVDEPVVETRVDDKPYVETLKTAVQEVIAHPPAGQAALVVEEAIVRSVEPIARPMETPVSAPKPPVVNETVVAPPPPPPPPAQEVKPRIPMPPPFFRKPASLATPTLARPEPVPPAAQPVVEPHPPAPPVAPSAVARPNPLPHPLPTPVPPAPEKPITAPDASAVNVLDDLEEEMAKLLGRPGA